MNDNEPLKESEVRLLAALRAVHPETQKPKLRSVEAPDREEVLVSKIFQTDAPAVLGWMKGGTLVLLAMTALAFLIAVQFRDSLDSPIVLFLLMLVGMACKIMLIVERIEKRFGRWQFTRRFNYVFVPAKR